MKNANYEPSGLISDYLQIAPRYVRSFEIERDFGDPAAVEGYILTPAVLFAATTLAGGLRKDSTQRAWRVTGPYGAGKSAFGVFLANTVARSGPGKRLLSQLEREAPRVHDAWKNVPRYLPVPITGSRTPFGQALVSRLLRSTKAISTRRPPKILRDLARLEARSHTSDEQVVEAVSRFVEYVLSATEYEGVLLIIDEMGKFLEHAALRPDQADAFLFQKIAEMSAGSSKNLLSVVGFLHQNFADYAVSYGERAQEEWSKVAQRFEDIPFDESLEQYGFLLGKAMQYPKDVLAKRGIEKRAKMLYAGSLSAETQAGRAGALINSSPNLYPIHPSVFLALATAVKRFGQSQRSLFSFLLAAESHGLQDFARSIPLNSSNWYRLPDLYNYLSALDGLAFRHGDRARKWELLRETLAHGPALEELETKLLKVVGLINVLDPVPALAADFKSLSRALTDTEDDAQVRIALDALIQKGLLYFRRAQGDYCLWRHSSVDLQALYEQAATQTRAITTLDDLLEAIGEGRALIAQRHYQQTGTLRAFRVRFASLEKLPQDNQSIDSYDGEVLVVLVNASTSVEKAAAQLASHALAEDPARLVVVRIIEQADLKVATEVRIYERIFATCKELRVDEFARREVEQNLDRVRRQLEQRLAKVSGLGDAADSRDAVWIYRGGPVKITSRKELNKRLSSICSELYSSAPILRNELINRHKLSSAISLARQKLIAAMLEKYEQPDLGLTAMPPERAIYLSLFKDTKLHRREAGAFGFYPPRAKDDDGNWGPVWRGLRDFLAKRGHVGLDEVLAFLGRPPFGLREGPALLLVLAVMLADKRNLVLFERGTYLPTYTEDHILRLTKNPRNFAIHLQAPMGGVQGIFAVYATALEPIKREGDCVGDAHGVVSCIYRWSTQLSEFAQNTTSLSPAAKDVRSILKRAMDPVELLTKSLPGVFGIQDMHAAAKAELRRFAEKLRAAFEEIDQADNTLRKKALFILTSAFGTEGSVTEFRNFLRMQFAPYKDVLGDHKLKAALGRALDKELGDKAWLDSIAGLLGDRAFALWRDDTLDKFKAETLDFAGKLKRWVALMVQLKSTKSTPGSSSLVSVYITGTSGKEHSLLVTSPSKAKASSEELKTALQRVIAMNPAEAPAALAQALADLLSSPAAEKGKEREDGN